MTTPHDDKIDAFTYSLAREGKPAYEELVRSFGELADTLNDLGNLAFDIFNEYPNKRVKHLAIYAAKERTRKKNLNRVIKWALHKRSGYGVV